MSNPLATNTSTPVQNTRGRPGQNRVQYRRRTLQGFWAGTKEFSCTAVHEPDSQVYYDIITSIRAFFGGGAREKNEQAVLGGTKQKRNASRTHYTPQPPPPHAKNKKKMTGKGKQKKVQKVPVHYSLYKWSTLPSLSILRLKNVTPRATQVKTAAISALKHKPKNKNERFFPPPHL